MGGKPPLGYIRKEKKIYPEEENAKKVKIIFEKYLELKSTIKLRDYLLEQRITSQTSQPLSIGNLDRILKNKAYLGLVGHNGIWYKGEHKGIIGEDLFNKVQEIMRNNRNVRNKYAPHKSLLAGKLFDDKGNYMSPSWSTGSKGKKYRYYVSQAIIKHQKEKIGKTSLRRNQWRLAETNPTMAIWLGKQYLNQTDHVEQPHDNIKVSELIDAFNRIAEKKNE